MILAQTKKIDLDTGVTEYVVLVIDEKEDYFYARVKSVVSMADALKDAIKQLKNIDVAEERMTEEAENCELS